MLYSQNKKICLAECIEERIHFILKESELLASSHIGSVGILLIYESENKYPAKPFIVFDYEIGMLHTSPGELEVDIENATITLITQQNNIYSFKILNGVSIDF